MKVAITGKGGVGKTTLAALLAQVLADAGHNVTAIDADPSPCLAATLGFPAVARAGQRPIAEMTDLIEDRTGLRPGTVGGYFSLNPRVDDLPERFSVVHRGVRLLELGGVKSGGSGCICPESAMLKALVRHLLFAPEDVLVLDMYAGVEHLGRATADFVDAMLVVVEPTRRSMAVAEQIKVLASDIGLTRLMLVGNKVRNAEDAAFLQAETPGLPVLGIVPASTETQEADRLGVAVYDHVPEIRRAAEQIADALRQQSLRNEVATGVNR